MLPKDFKVKRKRLLAYEMECLKCGKVFRSFSEKQLLQWAKMHSMKHVKK